ncbi:MAG: RNA polymerase sigma factor [Flavobacteriia bacterium]|jgi:RNA polymerase sigma-70 factor (ECF subfamily)|nr:RNA polymerase sigma factor [Cryomorphaceae bacterium]
MDEQELIQGCIAARPKAQKALFDIYAPKLYVVCLRYLKDQMRAQDVLQDTFVKIFAHIGNYKSEGAFEGWLKRIAVNTCLDQLRKDKKLLTDVSLDDVSHKLAHQDYSAEKLMADDLLKLVQALPDGYRTVFNLFAIEGFSHQEIAQQLSISESTSKTQYLRARAYLKERIENID